MAIPVHSYFGGPIRHGPSGSLLERTGSGSQLRGFGVPVGVHDRGDLIVARLWQLSLQNENQRENLRRQSLTIDNLLNANLDFQTYAAEIGEKSTIEERKRLTREVHDIVGYTLINIRMMLEAGIELTPPNQGRLKELLHQARDQVMSGLLEARRALRNFRAIDSNLLEGTNRLQRFIRSFPRPRVYRCRLTLATFPHPLGRKLTGPWYASSRRR